MPPQLGWFLAYAYIPVRFGIKLTVTYVSLEFTDKLIICNWFSDTVRSISYLKVLIILWKVREVCWMTPSFSLWNNTFFFNTDTGRQNISILANLLLVEKSFFICPSFRTCLWGKGLCDKYATLPIVWPKSAQ